MAGDITELLDRVRGGDTGAERALYERVYGELRSLARQSLARNSTLTELDAPGLVHEAYLRLAAQPELPGGNRRMFFAYAARAMRSVVTDYVRARDADKRGGAQVAITLTTGIADVGIDAAQLVAVDRALDRLRRIDQRGHDLFEMHFYSGLSVEDIAELTTLSPATVKRDLRKSRAFVLDALDT